MCADTAGENSVIVLIAVLMVMLNLSSRKIMRKVRPKNMNIELNDHDTAYIQFSQEKAEESIPIQDSGLILDFNENNELIGIETIQASKDLPKKLLEEGEALKDE